MNKHEILVESQPENSWKNFSRVGDESLPQTKEVCPGVIFTCNERSQRVNCCGTEQADLKGVTLNLLLVYSMIQT